MVFVTLKKQKPLEIVKKLRNRTPLKLYSVSYKLILRVSILPSTFRMYTRLITRIETTCSRLGKDDKFQLFICLAVHDRLLGRIVTDLTKAVAAQQVKLFTNHRPITVLFE